MCRASWTLVLARSSFVTLYGNNLHDARLLASLAQDGVLQ